MLNREGAKGNLTSKRESVIMARGVADVCATRDQNSEATTMRVFNDPELIGLDGTLAIPYERARIAAASGRAVALWGERGVGKETLARLIAREVDQTNATFRHLRGENATVDALDAVLRALVDTRGTLFISVFQRVPRAARRALAEVARDRSRAFMILVAFSQSFENCRDAVRDAEDLATGYPIGLPPLKTRSESEKIALANAFFSEALAREGVYRRPLSDGEALALANMSGAGNLDDLRTLVDALVINNVFPSAVEPTASVFPSPESASPPIERPRSEEKTKNAPFLTLDEAAKRHIEEALRRSRGAVEGKRGAAAMLGINPYTLRARMRKLGVDWVAFRDPKEG